MRILALCAAAALAVPAAAGASEPAPLPEFEPDLAYQEPLAEFEPRYEEPLSQRLGDSAVQDELATTVAVLGEMLLDMPLAPIVEPMAEMTGRDADSVDPDLTLRKMRPGASEVPSRIARDLPQMMDAMASMAGSLEAMRPALREMAERLEFSLDQAARGTR